MTLNVQEEYGSVYENNFCFPIVQIAYINTSRMPLMAFMFNSFASPLFSQGYYNNWSFADEVVIGVYIMACASFSQSTVQKVKCAGWKPGIVKKKKKEVIDCSLSTMNRCRGELGAAGLLSTSLRLKSFEAGWEQLVMEVSCLDSRHLRRTLQGMGKGLQREEVLPEFLAQFHRHLFFIYVTLQMSPEK